MITPEEMRHARAVASAVANHPAMMSSVILLIQAEEDPYFPEEEALAAMHEAVELLHPDGQWYDCLWQCAEMWEDEMFVEGYDMIYLAECALRVRCCLDGLFYRYINVEMHRLLEKLDEDLLLIRNAMFVIPPKHYYGILSIAEPEDGVWWAAQRDLDRDCPEEMMREIILRGAQALAEEKEKSSD